MKLKEALKGKLSTTELSSLRAGFDVIGTIAIIEIPRSLKKKEKIIAQTILTLLKNVKTIAVKKGGHIGKYRRQPLKIITGKHNFETTHIENGIKLFLNVEKCYYTPRLSTDRMTIAHMITKPERVLVVGAGIAPYPLVIAKHSPAKEIISLEHNPLAHKYAEKNILLNKFETKIKPIKASVTKMPELGLFDRIITPIPHKGVSLAHFLLPFTKKDTTLHIYDFAPEKDLEKPARKLILLCKKNNKNCKILRVRKAGQHAVRSYRVCVDAQIL